MDFLGESAQIHLLHNFKGKGLAFYMTTKERGLRGDQAKQLRKHAGRWLKVQRRQAGLTQKSLADRVGLDYYTFVSQIEGGHGRVPSALFPAWAAALGVDSAEFARKMLEFYDPHIFQALGFEASERTLESEISASQT